MPDPTEKQPVEPSGYTGTNPSTAGPGKTQVVANTPENAAGQLNPSAPANAGTTPGSTAGSTAKE